VSKPKLYVAEEKGCTAGSLVSLGITKTFIIYRFKFSSKHTGEGENSKFENKRTTSS